jgi:hypothetical protein
MKNKNDWNRVKQHLAQLPFVMYVSSDWSDELLSAGSSHTLGSRRSIASPKGVSELDDRRPWRKNMYRVDSKNKFSSSNETELIRHLKSQIKFLMSQVHSMEAKINGDNLSRDDSFVSSAEDTTASSTVQLLKSRLRSIESSFSSGKLCKTRNKSDSSSLKKLKARLRELEYEFGKSVGANIHVKS